MASSLPEVWLMENRNVAKPLRHSTGRTAHNLSSSSLRKKSDHALLSRVRSPILRKALDDVQEIFLGTKLSVLLVAIPFAIAAQSGRFASPWVFALSFIGLIPLAERVSFLTEQIAYYTGPTVGGLLNATCGNATELIIAIFALVEDKVEVVKYSLVGSILSNLLLVLGSSFFCGGIANLSNCKEQKFERKQADVNLLMLLLGLLCNILLLTPPEMTAAATLQLSRVSGVVMLIAYTGYLVFQLWTHGQLFEPQEVKDDNDGDDDDRVSSQDSPTIVLWVAIVWLLIMTATVALLSEYIVDTIEAASNSWGMSVGFISVILLPIVGNAAEHAGAMIFAFKNKLDISLGVALGSATQISMFVVPLTVVISWIIGGTMDLDFNLLQTSALTLAILVTAFALQDGTSHYIKGLILLLCYIVIGACFFVYKAPLNTSRFYYWRDDVAKVAHDHTHK